MAMSNIIRGTMLLTAASFLSKFLGMIYVIPFEGLVGAEGVALYSYAYIPYNILIAISTVGVPLAVSKFVSKYNSLGDYETGRRMFKTGTWLMLGTGMTAFVFLFFFAPILAGWFIPEGAEGSQPDAAFVIRMVSFALIIIPAMSIVRGYFQGHQSMGPTAVSQVIEQIVRIIFLLVATYLVLNVFNGTIRTAVGFATFAAFVGGVGSCVVLYIYWRKRKGYLNSQLKTQDESHNLPLKDLYKELLTYAGPFVLVGLATPLYQFIDQLTFNRAMLAINQGEIAEVALSNIVVLGHKLVVIPITLATGMSLATLPAITQSFTEKDKTKMFKQINQAFQIIMLLILPAAVGLSMLANHAWFAFYGNDGFLELNGTLLRWYAPVALGFAFFTVSASILQGINKQQFTLVSLFAGLLLKATLNYPLIQLFGAKGAVIATMTAVSAAALLNLWRIKKSVQFPYRQLLKRSALIAIFSTVMAIVVWLVVWVMANVFSYSIEDGRTAAVVVLIVSVIIGGAVYLALSYQSTLLERILGNRVRILNRFKRS